ncbi:oxide reductase [Gonapodya prolifera JEL478]|uniref:peptide-methionine (S)-S-oxide reductase n=1 Tax=Gonapodya prolifera (strain JEL478) TaxID=1344416 RepID=A0A139ABU9_GONPJ|nr:oxide reductase [Gonapodya prolifera JEL478]|eukprot:KXS14129.1 oxide reductase [Gonapodya prolifera JEL478]
MAANGQLAKATFGAGCFWGTEKFFKKEFGDGIVNAVVGYTGGHSQNPTYKQVCTGTTGHAEALEIEYRPEKVKYEDLVRFFFKFHDPTTLNRQGNDVGTQYRSAIFYYNPEQLEIAKAVTAEMQPLWKRPITTSFEPAGVFWLAEDYHQKYLEKNPAGYCNHYVRPLSK